MTVEQSSYVNLWTFWNFRTQCIRLRFIPRS